MPAQLPSCLLCPQGGCLSPGMRPPCCYKEVFLLLLALFPTALEQNSIYHGVVTQLHKAVHLIAVHRTVISKLKPFMKGDVVSLGLCCLKRWQKMHFHGT